MSYDKLVSAESVEKTAKALNEHNFSTIVVSSKGEALEKIKSLIPDGVSVMNGSSETLREIGFIDYLKSGEHKWNNLHAAVLAEKGPAKQAELRKQSVLSDFYLGSAHAVTETGEIMIASNTGSQLPHLAFTSQNIILVVGAQKITKSVEDSFKRIQEHVIPLEDVRMKGVYGFGTMWSKTLILNQENAALGRKFTVIIVNESLGY
jgi:hypothetical protein